MSLITFPTPTAPTPPPPVLTTAQAQEKAAAMLRELISYKGAFSQILGIYNRGMGIVFANADGLTPQQVLDSLGADAAQTVQFAGAIAGLINVGLPGTIPAPTAVLTINADGTVKVEGV